MRRASKLAEDGPSGIFECEGIFPYLTTDVMYDFEVYPGEPVSERFLWDCDDPGPYPLNVSETSITSNPDYTDWKVTVRPGSPGRRPFLLDYEVAPLVEDYWGAVTWTELTKHGAFTYVKCHPDVVATGPSVVYIRGWFGEDMVGTEIDTTEITFKKSDDETVTVTPTSAVVVMDDPANRHLVQAIKCEVDFTEPEGKDYVGLWDIEVTNVGEVGTDGAFILEDGLKVVRMNFVDIDGNVLEILPFELARDLEEITSYDGGLDFKLRAELSDEEEDSVEGTFLSLGPIGQVNYRVTLTLTRTTGDTFDSPPILLYKGKLDDTDVQNVETLLGVGAIVAPSSWIEVILKGMRKVEPSFRAIAFYRSLEFAKKVPTTTHGVVPDWELPWKDVKLVPETGTDPNADRTIHIGVKLPKKAPKGVSRWAKPKDTVTVELFRCSVELDQMGSSPSATDTVTLKRMTKVETDDWVTYAGSINIIELNLQPEFSASTLIDDSVLEYAGIDGHSAGFAPGDPDSESDAYAFGERMKVRFPNFKSRGIAHTLWYGGDQDEGIRCPGCRETGRPQASDEFFLAGGVEKIVAYFGELVGDKWKHPGRETNMTHVLVASPADIFYVSGSGDRYVQGSASGTGFSVHAVVGQITPAKASVAANSSNQDIEWLVLSICHQANYDEMSVGPAANKYGLRPDGTVIKDETCSSGYSWAKVYMKDRGAHGILGFIMDGWSDGNFAASFVDNMASKSVLEAWKQTWASSQGPYHVEDQWPGAVVWETYADETLTEERSDSTTGNVLA